MKRYKTILLLALPIVLLIMALLVPAIVSAEPGKAVSDNAAVHRVIYDTDTGATYNVIYHPRTDKWTVTGAEYPKSGPFKVK